VLYLIDATARVFAPVTVSGAFFGWVAQFGDYIEIENPESLRREYKAFLDNIQGLY
jgi:hypothetical protein